MDRKPNWERIRRLLASLQDEILDGLRRGRKTVAWSRVAAVTEADTIYGVDRVSEAVILRWFETEWPRDLPVELVMEGAEDGLTFPNGVPVERTALKCILDPIDGTRGLMYDKRSAWSLAAVAPQHGARTHLGNVQVAVMTELPTSKSGAADQYSAIRGRGVHGSRLDLQTGQRRKIVPHPSRARDLAHGFASFAKFFPDAKAWLAGLETELWTRLNAGSAVFDDQYLSSGGQLHELLTGRDRFVADLRPLAFRKFGLGGALPCHPYDVCTALVAQEAGCVITMPDGAALDYPLDTTTPVAWVGYANRSLARRIGPVLRELLRERA